MASWRIPELNGGSIGKITDFYGPFSIAMFDYRRVPHDFCLSCRSDRCEHNPPSCALPSHGIDQPQKWWRSTRWTDYITPRDNEWFTPYHYNIYLSTYHWLVDTTPSQKMWVRQLGTKNSPDITEKKYTYIYICIYSNKRFQIASQLYFTQCHILTHHAVLQDNLYMIFQMSHQTLPHIYVQHGQDSSCA